MDTQPGAPAADQRHRGRCATLWTPCRLRDLRQFFAARRPRALSSQTAAGNPVCGATPFPATSRSCCCRSADPANIDLVRQLVQAHAYWRLKGLAVDLVIWNEDHAGYRQLLQEQIMGLIAAGVEATVTERPGGIFVRPVDQISGEDRILLQTVVAPSSPTALARSKTRSSRRSIAAPIVPRPCADPEPSRRSLDCRSIASQRSAVL